MPSDNETSEEKQSNDLQLRNILEAIISGKHHSNESKFFSVFGGISKYDLPYDPIVESSSKLNSLSDISVINVTQDLRNKIILSVKYIPRSTQETDEKRNLFYMQRDSIASTLANMDADVESIQITIKCLAHLYTFNLDDIEILFKSIPRKITITSNALSYSLSTLCGSSYLKSIADKLYHSGLAHAHYFQEIYIEFLSILISIYYYSKIDSLFKVTSGDSFDQHILDLDDNEFSKLVNKIEHSRHYKVLVKMCAFKTPKDPVHLFIAGMMLAMCIPSQYTSVKHGNDEQEYYIKRLGDALHLLEQALYYSNLERDVWNTVIKKYSSSLDISQLPETISAALIHIKYVYVYPKFFSKCNSRWKSFCNHWQNACERNSHGQVPMLFSYKKLQPLHIPIPSNLTLQTYNKNYASNGVRDSDQKITSYKPNLRLYVGIYQLFSNKLTPTQNPLHPRRFTTLTA